MRLVIWLCVLVLVGFTLDAARRTWSSRAEASGSNAAVVRTMGLIQPGSRRLSDRFADVRGRLLADAPTDPTRLIDPQTIVLAHIDSTDAANPGIPWLAFEAHLASATGRKVTDASFHNSSDELKQIEPGAITLVALHAADTPFLVDNFGFQPAAVLADNGAVNGNHMDIIVPASSPITAIDQLRGHTLVCSVPSSITGYRSAVAILMQQANLRPNVDYTIIWSMGQKRSILGVADNKFQAAAVSDDKLKSLVQEGELAESSCRVIHQSDVIPRTTIGWFYNLKPELAETLRTAILDYRPVAASTDARGAGGSAKPLHFVSIDYKKDFVAVRQIDGLFDPRLDMRSKTSKSESANAAARSHAD